jgi:hypothetical protein
MVYCESGELPKNPKTKCITFVSKNYHAFILNFTFFCESRTVRIVIVLLLNVYGDGFGAKAVIRLSNA